VEILISKHRREGFHIIAKTNR